MMNFVTSLLVLSTICLFLSSCTILRSPESLSLPEKTVILTFDDGPNPRSNVTQNLLSVLDQHEVKASFCVVGLSVEKYPELVKDVYNHGHDLVNHSQTHFFPLTKTKNGVWNEIEACDAAIANALGKESFQTEFYRPPYGVITSSFENSLEEKGIKVVPVTFFIRDVTLGPDECEDFIQDTIARLRDEKSGVIVIHEARYRKHAESDKSYNSPVSGANRSWVPDAVDQIITELSAEGFEFLSYSEVLDKMDSPYSY